MFSKNLSKDFALLKKIKFLLSSKNAFFSFFSIVKKINYLSLLEIDGLDGPRPDLETHNSEFAWRVLVVLHDYIQVVV